jgi:hypothetical protein
LDTLANGNWRQNDVIDHWSSTPISIRVVINKFQNAFVWAVSSAAPFVYPRHRWTGADDTMRWVLILQSCHGLLSTVYKLWVGSTKTEDQQVGADVNSFGHQPPDDPGGIGGVPGGGLERQSGRPEYSSITGDLVAFDPSVANTVHNIVNHYQAEQSTWRRNATSWVGSAATLPTMLIFRRVHEGHRRLLRAFLEMAGMSWERKQAWQELQTVLAGGDGFNARDFRVTIAQSGMLPVWYFDCVFVLSFSQ